MKKIIYTIIAQFVLSPFLFAQEVIDLPPPIVDHIVYLIGDAGNEGEYYSTPVMSLLEELGRSDGSKERTVVFLGDNIYPYGMHAPGTVMREQDQASIDAQIDAAKAITDNVIFIPGNHDWRQTKQYGLEYVRRQERYVEARLESDAWLPDNGCPGPVEIDLTEDANLIILDTQWWLHPFRKAAGIIDGCDNATVEGVMEELEDKMSSSEDKRTIVVGHHPMYTYGPHGGAYRFKAHIFPLTGINKNLYIPLPVIGSIYPMYRKLLGNVQDMPHGKYLDMQTQITSLLSNYPGTVYAAGHEHSLQYTVEDSVNYIVSGSGCKTSFLSRSPRLAYGVSERGFSTVTIMSDGSMDLKFYTVSGGVNPAFTKRIAESNPFTVEKEIADEVRTKPFWQFPDSVTIAPNTDLEASGLKRFMFGDLYRDVWTAPITVPIVNLDTAYGGIRPLDLGGGKQTRSLDLESVKDENKVYTLRSIRKYPGSALEPELRESVVKNIVEDGIAGSFPYAALAIPRMSRPIELLHTDPTMVYVPETDQLEKYKTIYGNTLALLEEEPEGVRPSEENLGNSFELIDTGDLTEELFNDHLVDVADDEFLRARLFDLIIGDWDRHEGQWAWAKKSKGQIDLYRPIAQDRDQAFFRVDGLLPNLVSSRWARNELSPFGPEVKDIAGLTKSGRSLDRALLNDLTWEEWKAEVEYIIDGLTDEVINEAIAELPKAAVELEGDFLKDALRSRRDDLMEIGRSYYELLSDQVDIVGTNLEERFVVDRIDDEQTRVRMYGIEDPAHGEDVLMFDRIFLRAETKEVRLYGLNGADTYELNGEANQGIKVRIIGGFDDDRYIANANVKGLSKKTVIHERSSDTSRGLENTLGKDVKLKVTSDQEALIYLWDGYENNSSKPMLLSGYNIDDGAIFGLGFHWISQGFRTDPYRLAHEVKGVYSPLTNSVLASYTMHRPRLVGNWGFGLDIEYKGPEYAHNWFGFGNGTDLKDGAHETYDIQAIDVRPYIDYSIKQAASFKIGAEFIDIQDNLDVSLSDTDIQSPFQADPRYVGAFVAFEVENHDDILDPGRGIVFNVEGAARDVHQNERNQYTIGTELRMYIPLNVLLGRTVWALRGGLKRTDGPLSPYTAQSIGGDMEVRGMHRNRFLGNSSAYFNSEFRLDLFRLQKRSILPLKVGLTTFFDGGSVKMDGSNGSRLHYAYGGGLFFRPMKMAVLSIDYGISDDDEALTIRLGHYF